MRQFNIYADIQPYYNHVEYIPVSYQTHQDLMTLKQKHYCTWYIS